MLFCCVAGCPELVFVHNHGLCRPHYKRMRRHGDPAAGGPMRPGRPTAMPVRDHDDGSRTCNVCDERKDFASFPVDANGTRGRRTTCKVCHTAKEMARYNANPESHRAQIRGRRVVNGDALRVADKLRYERDRDKRIELAIDHTHRRRARMLGLPQDPGITVSALRKRDGDDCFYCKRTMEFVRSAGRAYVPLKATVEHVLPLSRGGYHVWENVALACWQCNLRKNAKTTDEWRAA